MTLKEREALIAFLRVFEGSGKSNGEDGYSGSECPICGCDKTTRAGHYEGCSLDELIDVLEDGK